MPLHDLPAAAHTLPVRATVLDALPSADLSEVRVAMEQAGPQMITDGMPTVTYMSAWLCHEGVNRNRLGFLREDLGPAAAKITPKTPIVMDFNHSAISGWGWEPQCIGVWYHAEVAWDAAANDGAGAFGILARGVMFAWLFPQLADLILAEQQRKGYVEFSMACIPTRLETGRDEDGPFEMAREPVFFTLSVLDVPPADPDAQGYAQEGSDPAVQLELDSKCLAPIREAALVQVAAAQALCDAAVEESAMNEELKALLAGLEDRLQQQVEAAMQAALESKTREVASLELRLDEATTAKVSLEAKVAELLDAAQTLETALGAAHARIEELEAAEAARVAAEADAARQARLAARIAALPAAAQAAHMARPADRREKLEAKWVAMTDEEWAEYTQDELGIGSLRVSFLERSRQEGVLPVSQSTNGSSDWAARLARLTL